MVLLKQTTFLMGLDSVQLQEDMQRFNKPAAFFSHEYPAFRVTVQPFYIDKFEVTNADFKKFIDDEPQWSKSNMPDSLQDGNYLKDWKENKYPKHKDDYPVVYINWYAAVAYSHWAGKRLPTEAEWEYAARGLNYRSTTYPWGTADIDTTKANYADSHIGHTSQIARYHPNALGIYDMAGNVRQFCADSWIVNQYAEFKAFKKDRNTKIRYLKTMRAIRGGGWIDPAVNLRVTSRDSCLVTTCRADVGFRCAANFYQPKRYKTIN
jgi:sulfatase modifying factor 1